MHTWRTASLLETAAAWKSAIQRNDGPSSIILTRQNIDNIENKNFDDVSNGGYFLRKFDDSNIHLIASGSEVSLALEAADILEEEGIKCNVASVPCIEILETNKQTYEEIFAESKINIAIECSHPNSWYAHTKNVIGIKEFGESGKGKVLMEHFGFTSKKIVEKIKSFL
jgi:transketolase